ncbi:MAG: DNA recombination protein RmuC [Bacteroidales bacterium]|jgi:DNA recombination protein RmuC|nr:DNA recombination protein RmuC [Bacteroidales bacterium]
MEVAYMMAGVVAGFILGFILIKLYSKNQFLNREKELESQKHVLESKNSSLETEILQLKTNLQKETDKREEATKLNVKYQSDFEHISEKLDNERKQLEELQKKFATEFENIANKILKQNTLEFSQTSVKNMGELINPLKERIKDFEKKVEDTYNQGLKDQTDLKVELRKLHELSLALDKDAKDLTKALKSDSKKQGNWGEVILERVLERSGLIKGEEYYMQFTGKSEDGSILRPDVVIRLPEEKHLVIDSKVSLTAYTEFASADTEVQRDILLKKHLDSIRKHIKELSDKNYASLLGINSPDFVLMFLPIEPAFGLAVQNDHELFNYAWQQKVIIVSPTTLLATLRTVASIWKYEKQTQNAIEIAKRGGLLYDKFVNFVKDLEDVGKSIAGAEKAYNEAHKKLVSGRGDLINQAEQLKTMGVVTKKSLPAEYLETDE